MAKTKVERAAQLLHQRVAALGKVADFEATMACLREVFDPASCNAAEDEPIFTLRAHDKIAPRAVGHWAILAHEAFSPAAKVDEATKRAQEMTDWQREHGSKVPD